MFSIFSKNKESSQKSKIVSEDRFTRVSLNTHEYVFGATNSSFKLLQKKPKGNKTTTSHIWLSKTDKELDKFSSDEKKHDESLRTRYEVFSAWQYESFIGDSQTQPKYYLVTHPNKIDSVTTKHVTGYKSIMNYTSQQLFTIFSGKNLKLFSQMLVTYMNLAGSDLKREHIGINKDGVLVCMDFGESLISLRSSKDYQQRKGLNFSITPDDLRNAPYFKTYRASNYFIEKSPLPFLKNNKEFKAHYYAAVLKRCIFPKYITFAALELFDDSEFREYGDDLQCYVNERTEEFLNAALNTDEFLNFITNDGERAFEEIQCDILNSGLRKKRYFRNNEKGFETKCTEELNFNFSRIQTKVKLHKLRKKSESAFDVLMFLRDFCEAQYDALKTIDETYYFKKGAQNKCILFMELLTKINETDFIKMSPLALEEAVLNLIRETAIIAHHRRYSIYNNLFLIPESNSWVEFKKIAEISPQNRYALQIRDIVTHKEKRTVKRLNQEICTYQKYRSTTEFSDSNQQTIKP